MLEQPVSADTNSKKHIDGTNTHNQHQSHNQQEARIALNHLVLGIGQGLRLGQVLVKELL